MTTNTPHQSTSTEAKTTTGTMFVTGDPKQHIMKSTTVVAATGKDEKAPHSTAATVEYDGLTEAGSKVGASLNATSGGSNLKDDAQNVNGMGAINSTVAAAAIVAVQDEEVIFQPETSDEKEEEEDAATASGYWWKNPYETAKTWSKCAYSSIKTQGEDLLETVSKAHQEVSAAWKPLSTTTKKVVVALLVAAILLPVASKLWTSHQSSYYTSLVANTEHSMVMHRVESLERSVQSLQEEQLALHLGHLYLAVNVSETQVYVSALLEELGSQQNHLGRTVQVMKQLQQTSLGETRSLNCSTTALESQVALLDDTVGNLKITTDRSIYLIDVVFLFILALLTLDAVVSMTVSAGHASCNKFTKLSRVVIVLFFGYFITFPDGAAAMPNAGGVTKVAMKGPDTTMKGSAKVPKDDVIQGAIFIETTQEANAAVPDDIQPLNQLGSPELPFGQSPVLSNAECFDIYNSEANLMAKSGKLGGEQCYLECYVEAYNYRITCSQYTWLMNYVILPTTFICGCAFFVALAMIADHYISLLEKAIGDETNDMTNNDNETNEKDNGDDDETNDKADKGEQTNDEDDAQK